MSDYDTWHALVPTHGSPEPESPIGAGFWRVVSSKGHARPIATWSADDTWFVLREGLDEFNEHDNRGAFLKFMADGWSRLEAWSERDYEKATESGVWPDGVPAMPREAIGDNQPPEDSKLDELVEKLDALVAEATKLAQKGEAKTQAEADVAANLKSRIRTVRQEIVSAHKTEKAPVLAEGRHIDGLWFPHRDRADKLERRLHEVVVRPWLLEQSRLAEEARRAKKVGEPDIPGRINAGAKGMKDSLRPRYTGTIEDYNAFYEAVRDHDEVQQFMANYAQRIAANLYEIKASLPGLTVTKEMV